MATFSGGKFTGSHSTAIDAAVPLIKAANKKDEVTKVILGVIRTTPGAKGGSRKMKITDVDAGLRVVIKQNAASQEIFIYTDDKHAVASALAKAFENKK